MALEKVSSGELTMNDKEKVRDAINALYIGAGIKTTFNGKINEQVAKVFGQLLDDIHDCSVAFRWVPKPSGSVASIAWIAKNLTRSAIEKFKGSQSFTCARTRILQYQTPLRLASLGI